MDFSARETCSHARRDGTPCRAAALPGKDCCTFHDPELAARRAAGRRQGGETRSRRAAVLATAGDVIFGCVTDVTRLLGDTASQVRRGEIDVRIANALAYTASIALRALVPDEAGKEIEALRQEVAELRRSHHGDGNHPSGTNGAPARGGQPQGGGRHGADPGPLPGRPVPADGGRGLDAGRLADDVAPLNFD
jgi:hypothetical protein